MSLEEFQVGPHGSHLGYLNGMILAILNRCVPVMLPIKFWLNPTFSLGGDVVWRIWISKQNNLSNSEFQCRTDATHKVSAQSDLWLWRRYHLKNFKMAALAAISDIGTEHFCNSKSLCHCDASHQVLAQSNLRFGRRCGLKNFKMAAMDIRMQLWISMSLRCLP